MEPERGAITVCWACRHEVTLYPNTVHIPSFHPTPRVVYVIEGQGLFGLTIPGCAETFSSQEEEQQQQHPEKDQHQKIRHVYRGDVVVVPAGAAHWAANHHHQENLVVLVINDLNHLSNLLDQDLRVFYLAGGLQQPPEQQEQQPSFANIIRNLDPQLLAEAANIPVDIVTSMQREDQRGFILNAEHSLSGIIGPGIEQQEGQGPDNGLEETICTAKVHTNVERFREADVYSRQAGRVSVVDQSKLPILRYVDLSVEKGELFPDAIVSPHWTSGHSIIYVISGDAQVEAVGYTGENVINDRVNPGDLVVIPQFFVATIRAGANGFEWVAVKTSGTPIKHNLAGYTSVLRAEPLDVITHSYLIPPSEGEAVKR